MNCPCLKEEYVGVCTASPLPFVPSIAELEQFCFCERFTECPVHRRQTSPEPHGPEHVNSIPAKITVSRFSLRTA